MDTKLKIRPATEDDIATLLNLIKELAEYEKLSDEVSATEELLSKNLFGKKAFAEALIAQYEHEVCGMAIFFHNFSTFLAKPGLYLEDIFVRPKFRGLGIGTKIFKHLMNIAKERDCGRIEWAVLDWNESAINFYKKLNAVAMDDWTVYRLTDKYF